MIDFKWACPLLRSAITTSLPQLFHSATGKLERFNNTSLRYENGGDLYQSVWFHRQAHCFVWFVFKGKMIQQYKPSLREWRRFVLVCLVSNRQAHCFVWFVFQGEFEWGGSSGLFLRVNLNGAGGFISMTFCMIIQHAKLPC